MKYVEAAGLRLSAIGVGTCSSAQGSGLRLQLRRGGGAGHHRAFARPRGQSGGHAEAYAFGRSERIVGKAIAIGVTTCSSPPSCSPSCPSTRSSRTGRTAVPGASRRGDRPLPGALAQPGGAGQGHHEGTRCAPARGTGPQRRGSFPLVFLSFCFLSFFPFFQLLARTNGRKPRPTSKGLS